MNKNRWTLEEVAFLRENYPNLGCKKCSEILNRTEKSVSIKASRLNISLKDSWSQEQIEDLLINYPSRGVSGCCVATLNKSSAAVHAKAAKLGLSGPKPADLLRWNNSLYDDKLFEKQLDAFRLEDYINSRTPILHTCSLKHTWKAKPASVIAGSGCPECSCSGFNPSKSALLYYIKVEGFYKIGVTNRTVEKRFSNAKYQKDIELIDSRYYAVGSEALALEKSILKEFEEFKVVDPDILVGNGASELFTVDVLGGKLPPTSDQPSTHI